jgi:hypothetical protein
MTELLDERKNEMNHDEMVLLGSIVSKTIKAVEYDDKGFDSICLIFTDNSKLCIAACDNRNLELLEVKADA